MRRVKHSMCSILVVCLLLTPVTARGETRGCPGDINGDGAVDLGDLAILLAAYDTCAGDPLYNPDADLDDSGCVGLGDLASLLAVYGTTCPDSIVETELAGNTLNRYPYFEYVRAFNENATVEVAIDPTRFPDLVGWTADIYIVEARTEAEWIADPALVDVTVGGAQTETFGGTSIQDNTFMITAPYELSADAGIGLGVGYDVVLDLDRDGELGTGDFIDGFGDQAGMYAVHDTTQRGPLSVAAIVYSGGTWLGQNTYFPADIASMGQLPLIAIAHGGGHSYTWYGHIGQHMASYGYIVMAHQTNNGPGIETSSNTVLSNTDYIIGNQSVIGGGVLDGHIDSRRIIWIGHSRGGEGVVRAYDRLYDGAFTPEHYSLDDVILLSSMAPTDFLGPHGSNPHAVNYHLWTASGDSDVSGAPYSAILQTFHLHDRATNSRHSSIIQGAGHGWFHDFDGGSSFSGPCAIFQENTHLILKGFFLPLIKHYAEGNLPATDFFWRQYESFHPIGVPEGTDPCIVVTNTYRPGATSGRFVIDDYQTEFSTDRGSSGGAITFDVSGVVEDALRDTDGTFDWFPADPMNGMTHARTTDTSRGVVFEWNGGDRFYELEIVPEQRDFSGERYLSFRACQGTRHPYTVAELGDLTFTVSLRDAHGTLGSINIGSYGGGIEEPYQRRGAGDGTGWFNEFETIRIRLTDFLTDGSGLDLTDIAAVRFDFGPSFGSNEGRLGLDEIEISFDPRAE